MLFRSMELQEFDFLVQELFLLRMLITMEDKLKQY